MSTEQVEQGGGPTPEGRPATDVLATYADEASAHRAPWLLVGGVGLLVLGLVAGVTYGVGSFSGGGAQPEDALPAGAIGFVKVDLDPSAGQKVDAFRFLRKFPTLRAKLGAGDDLRRVVFEAVADGAGWGDVDYGRDVEPWLGQRIALAAYPSGQEQAGAGLPAVPEPTVVLALQVSDPGAAETGLDKLIAKADGADKPGYVLREGYALLAQTQKEAEKAAADAERGALADAATFREDVAGADGVAVAWVDMGAAETVLGRAMSMGFGMAGLPGVDGSGRSTYVLHFDGPDVLELTGTVTGADSVAGLREPVTGFAELPGDSAAALGFTGGEELVQAMYESMGKAFDDSDMSGAPGWEGSIAEAERELGIEIPEDLGVLLGRNAVGAMDWSADDVELGARVTTDGERASAVLDKIEAAARRTGQDMPIVRERTDDGVVVGSSRPYVDRLTADGDLGDNPMVRTALPDLDDAGFALWVDIRTISANFMGGGGEADEDIEPIDGIGMTAVSDGAGSATYRVRLVAR